MCGIGGIIYKKNKIINIDNTLVKIDAMNQTQHRRGPDNSDVYYNDNVFLFHNRLSIIDLSLNGNQPMSFNNLTIVFNGEIYNANDLKNEYLQDDYFIGHSDTEILIHLIYKYGIEFTLNKLNGMFAFCVSDNITGDLFLVRDRIGQKPLYYFINDDVLYFASNPSSIVMSLPEYEWTLNYEALWEYFVMGGIFSQKTLFNGILRLDSASFLKYNDEIIFNQKYWTPNYIENVNDNSMESLIKDSIEKVKISDVPVGLFLSGGIDSSLVASVFGDINGIHLSSDETSIAQFVANKLNINLDVIEPIDFNIEEILFDFTKFSGEPTMAGFIPYITSKHAIQKYKVAISANGADELFYGYVRIPTPNISNSIFNNLNLKGRYNIHGPSGDYEYQLMQIFRNPSTFTTKNSENKTIKDLHNLIKLEVTKLNDNFPKSSQFRWLELMTYIKGDLNPTLDFASMANSLEVRCPFLDHRLIETALSIDETKHIDGIFGRKKYLKKLLKDYGFEENMWNRDKLGFSLKASYLYQIEELKQKALKDLQQSGLFKINGNVNNNDRDTSYLKSAAIGFYYWKKSWIDTGIVKL